MEGVTRQCLRKPQLLEKKSVSKEGSNQGASFICSTLSHSPTKPKPLSVSALSCQFPIGQDRNLWFNVLPSLYSLDPPSHPKTKSVLFFFFFFFLISWSGNHLGFFFPSRFIYFQAKLLLTPGQNPQTTVGVLRFIGSTETTFCSLCHYLEM